jgi:transposase-like protein
MSEKKRRYFDSAFKAKIVRRHVSGKEPVSDLAAELEIQPSVIHQWVNLVLEQAEHAFDRSGRPSRAGNSQQKRIEQLEAKIVQKNEVIAELMEDNVRSKKAAGDL